MYAAGAAARPGLLLPAGPRGLRGDGAGRVHERRRVPLPAPRTRREAVRRPERDGPRAAPGGGRRRDSADAARHLLPGRWFRRRPDEVQRRFSDGDARRLGGAGRRLEADDRVAGRGGRPLGAGGARRPARTVAAAGRGSSAARPSVRAAGGERGVPSRATAARRPSCWTSTACCRATDRRARHAPHRDGHRRARRGAPGVLLPDHRGDLGDGIGPARELRDAGVRLCLGSDSNAMVDPFEETRALELDERLASGQRGRFSAESCCAAGTDHARDRLARGRPARRRARARTWSPWPWTRCARPGPSRRVLFAASGPMYGTVVVAGREVVPRTARTCRCERPATAAGGRRSRHCGSPDHRASANSPRTTPSWARLTDAAAWCWTASGSPWVGTGRSPPRPPTSASTSRAARCCPAGWTATPTWCSPATGRPSSRRGWPDSPTPQAESRITVDATRAASDEQLAANLRRHVDEAAAQGTTCLETKTGYGLTVADEARCARIAGEVADEVTFLGAHLVPPGADADDYVDLVCGDDARRRRAARALGRRLLRDGRVRRGPVARGCCRPRPSAGSACGCTATSLAKARVCGWRWSSARRASTTART